MQKVVRDPLKRMEALAESQGVALEVGDLDLDQEIVLLESGSRWRGGTATYAAILRRIRATVIRGQW